MTEFWMEGWWGEHPVNPVHPVQVVVGDILVQEPGVDRTRVFGQDDRMNGMTEFWMEGWWGSILSILFIPSKIKGWVRQGVSGQDEQDEQDGRHGRLWNGGVVVGDILVQERGWIGHGFLDRMTG